MGKRLGVVWMGLALMATGVMAQNTFPASGNVGIGTTAPQASLDVVNTSLTSTTINANVVSRFSSNAIGADSTLQITDNFANNYFLSGSQGNMYFSSGGVNPSPQMTILGSGNIGIGTTAPGAPLEIDSGSVTNFNQVYNALYLRPAVMYGGYGGSGSSLLLGAPTNSGIQPLAGIWSSLTNGGSVGSVNYAGALVLGSTVVGQSTPSERMRIDGSGNVGIGTTSPGAALEVNGSGIKLTAGSGGSITFQDGTQQNTAFNPANCGADYAESVGVTGDRTKYAPGDILVIDPNTPGQFLKSNQAYSTLVAGVYSTQPGFVGRKHPANAASNATEVPMAMVGRVPTKVSAENGSIQVGDLLVSSSTMGYAMKGTDRSQMLGAVLGKALGSLDSGAGVIEVLVTLQ